MTQFPVCAYTNLFTISIGDDGACRIFFSDAPPIAGAEGVMHTGIVMTKDNLAALEMAIHSCLNGNGVKFSPTETKQ